METFTGDVPIQQIVYEQFSVTTIIEHDTNAAALGESCLEQSYEQKDLLYVAVDAVSAGVVLNSRFVTFPPAAGCWAISRI